MTHKKQLDEALEYLRDHIAPQGTFLFYNKHKAEFNNQEFYLFKRLKEIGVEEYLWLPMVYYLDEDKYIQITYDPPEDEAANRPPNQLKITFGGIMFINSGGYVGEEKRRIEKEVNESLYREKAETLAKRLADWTETLATRTKSLMIATWAVAVGAIGLVLWEMRHWILNLFS